MPAWISSTEAVLVYIAFPDDRVAPGDLTIDLDTTWGALFYIDLTSSWRFERCCDRAIAVRFHRGSSPTGPRPSVPDPAGI
jgi:hypothetical protein